MDATTTDTLTTDDPVAPHREDDAPPVAADVGDPTTPPPDPGRPVRRWRVVATTLALVAAAVLAATGLSLRAVDDGATATLRAEDAAVHRAVGQELVAEVDLSTARAQRDQATAVLGHETALLGAAESELAGERSTLSTQGVDIAELSTCLTGVQEALNAVSLGDVPDAVTALQGVGAACRNAAPG
jgi:hypothetical protein